MMHARLLAFSLLGAAALVACGSAKSGVTTTGSGGATGSGGPTGSGSVGGGSTASAGGAGGSSGTQGVGGLILDVDAGSGDGASTCAHLNIGILGNPGADASANFQQWLEMSGTTVTRIQTTAVEPVTAATLQPFDVVILDWLTRDYTAGEAAVFAAFVTAGGGVASMTGYDNNTTDDWHANSLLAPLQIGYSGPLFNGPITTFAPHPITAGLTSVTFLGGYGIADLGGTASKRTPLATLAQPGGDATVGYAVEMGAGRAFVWGDEWIEFDSEWSALPEIKQLWVQVFAWISPKNTCALMPPQ